MRNKIALYLGLALLTVGCAKDNTLSTGESARQYLDVWIAEFHPELQQSASGLYLMQDQPGSGVLWDASKPYTLGSVTIRTLDGTISSTQEEKLAQQLGTWVEGNYYGPRVFGTGEGVSYAGVDALLEGMKMGGTRTAIIPAWMITTSRFDSQEAYINAASYSSSLIYTVSPVEQIEDLTRWEKDSLTVYAKRNFLSAATNMAFPGNEAPDSSFFFVSDSTAFANKEPFARDTTVKINYVGRLLNGQVFDTNKERVAKDAGIYDSSRTYEPASVTFASEYGSISMGDSSDLIDGFQAGLYKMRWRGQKAIVLFISSLGYSYSGSGETIPPYSPLQFELEILAD